MSFEFVGIERSGPIAIVTLQRPDKLNALNGQVIAEIGQAFAELAAVTGDDAVRAAVLTGAGKAFVAGADIAAMVEMTSLEARRFSWAGHVAFASIEELAFPVIAAVNGFALGGGLELALACDFILASDAAKFGQPEATLAVVPGFGGTQRLARRVGVARARELLYTGDILDAQQAAAIGLANAVVPAAELALRARDVALKIASRGPLAVAACKRLVLRGEDLDLRAANELESETFGRLFGTEDQRAGMRAFLAKQKTTFGGR